MEKWVEPPCYDRAKKKDCPNRRAGCAAACDKWKKYIEERNKIYQRRKAEASAEKEYKK